MFLFFLGGGYNCQYSENEQKLNHQCGRKCKIIDKGEESVGEVGTDDEIDVIIYIQLRWSDFFMR